MPAAAAKVLIRASPARVANSPAGTALADQRHRLPAAVTFLVAASGIAVGGIGAAFWGLVAGSVMLLVLPR